MDVLIHREVRRWQLAGQDPGDIFRGFYVSDEQAEALIDRPAASNWGHEVNLDPAEADSFSAAQEQASARVLKILQEAHSQGITPRLERLAAAFRLTSFDIDILLICLAPTIDLRYERLYGYLHDDVTRKHPSVNLVLDLLCEPGFRRQICLRRLMRDAPLFQKHILSFGGESSTGNAPLLSRLLYIDETIAQWLQGHYQPPVGLGSKAEVFDPILTAEDELLAGTELSNLILDSEHPPMLVFYGSDLTRQAAAARCISARWKMPLLSVDLTSVIEEDLEVSKAIELAMRDSQLIKAVLFINGWDACLNDGSPPPTLVAECCAHPGSIILSGRNAWQPSGVPRQRNLIWVEFSVPTYAARLALWKNYLGPSTAIEETKLIALAGQFQMTSGQIRDAYLAAREIASQDGRPLEEIDLFTAARRYSNPRLSGLAHKIVPRYSWSDIVLPDDQIALLHEIIATVRGRQIVLDDWGIGRKLVASRGVTILFSGPPGTGKTMAAEVMAKELNLDLFKIDLSTIVSKYIGETEKNLERIFNEAETSNAILFFDEADALFGKRSEVRDSHDRYANIEISYLLQRMEAYDGVTILATNLRSNLDEAFTRRLQFSVDFPFPEEVYRLRIWKTLFPVEVPHAADLDLKWLAQRFKLAGGSIRNIIVNAAYLAASDGGEVRMEHLLHGTRRELQKMGRLLDDEGEDL